MPHLRLEVKPDWSEIEVVRRRSAAFLDTLDLASATIDAVAMVTRELVENAAKYGVYQRSEDRVAVELVEDGGRITVTVKSPVGEVNLARLEHVVRWIRGFPDPLEAYVERVKEIAAQADTGRGSGLGLVRIAYEGQSAVDYRVDDEILTMTAVHTVREKRPSPEGRYAS